MNFVCIPVSNTPGEQGWAIMDDPVTHPFEVDGSWQ
eukprot:CAMPEP_0204640942 /NCGR_PEP_ID=MMETSP0717-20131115/49447_1 /ASSEMBLY_ACC=CAM_ASM_000666 /TAXON_ID=230516 /ORGANISM="Chaetoceros curvisetus" /LENGTH=35 /DNA_ID= /DNA_START= /DNA_END= /DNA_ORIENTATION=